MYKYIRNYPSDREMGWSDELQGVSHDSNNWFFTQNGNIWKFPLSHDLDETCKSENRSKGIYKNAYGYRLGDCDCYNNYLFVPVTGDGTPYIAVFDASDLSFVAKDHIKRFDIDYHSIHWCAINPNDGCLYTSDENLGNDFKNTTTPIMVYDIDWNKIRKGQRGFLRYKTFIKMYTSTGVRLTRKYVQGGCFDDANHLHISNGEYTLKVESHNYANEKGGISVFYIPPMSGNSTSGYYNVKRIAYSNQKKLFQYQFNGTGEEPAGLTYWDLSNKKVPGKIEGCLHAIMSDNSGSNADDFYFKHYSRTTYKDLTCNQYARKTGVIITTEEYGLNRDLSLEDNRRRKNQELVAGLYNNRNIDYMIIENQSLYAIFHILEDLFKESTKKIKNPMSYIYINCHGNKNGLTLGYLKTANEFEFYTNLKEKFDVISGKRIIMIDSCESGGATPLLDPNSYVIVSAEEDKLAKGDSVLGNWATRYWVCGAGYDFLPGQAHDMEADSNKNKKVSLKELCDYTNRKLKNNSRLHRCQIISNDPNGIIFE